MKRNLLLRNASGEMPKMKNNFFKFLFFISLLVCNTFSMQAQGSRLTEYNFLPPTTSTPYVDMVGGTSIPFTTLSLPVGSSFGGASNFNAGGIPIGFNFAYNNAIYSTVNIHDNGYISFGANIASVANPIGNTAAYSGAISGYGYNLVGNNVPAGATATSTPGSNAFNPDGADITYLTTGTPGNQVFTVEYKNLKRRFITTTHNGLVNFQIRLYETDMRIEIHYKSFASTSATALQGQVGLRGVTNADFRARQTAWVGGSDGANNATLGTSNVAGPPAGLLYTWIPVCFSPTALLTNLQVDNTTVNFSWTAPQYLTATFTGYNWEVRTSGLPGSGAVGLTASGSTASTSDTVTGLTSGIRYFFYVKSNCGPWTTTQSTAGAISAGTTITVNSTVGLTVGTSVLVSAGVGGFSTATTIVSITNATQFVVSSAPTVALSGGATVVTYSVYTTGTITPTCTTPVFPYNENFEGVVAPAIPNCTSTVINVGSAPMRTRDAASAILFPGGTPIGPYGGFGNKNLITGNAANQDTWFFSRAISLTIGTTYRVSYKYGGSREAASNSQRLRVAIGLTASDAGMTTLLADHVNIKTTPNTFTFHFVAAATGAYFLGFRGTAGLLNGYLQVDDISLNTPTCAPPTSLLSGLVTYNSAIVSWTAPASAPSAGYEYIVSTSATPPISTTAISGANLGTVTTLTGLSPSTTYNVWVRSNCGGEYSAWTPLTPTFTTAALPPAPCFPAPTSVDGTGITNVTVGSINNTTGAEPGRYGDYASLITNIARNTTVPVTIRYSTGTFSYWTKIWIDFNDNGSFADAGETVYNSFPAPGELPPGVNNISFFVPVAAPLGQHRMRIGGSDTNNLEGFGAGQGPCYNGSWGTFEDYSVFVTTTPPPLTLSSPSTSFCNGGTSPLVTLNFNAHSGAPAVRYDNFVWNPSAGVVGTPAGGYTFSPTNPGLNVYTLTATQATFPFISNTVTYTVTVNDRPTPIVFTPATLAVCEGIPTALTSGGGIVTGALIFEENFNGSDVFTRVQQLIPPVLPADPPLVPYGPWIAVNNSVGGVSIPAAAWTLRNSPYVYGGNTLVSNDASQFCMSNSDAQGNGGGSTTNTELITPLLSFVGYTNVSLSYWQHYRNFPAGVIETQIWNDADNSGTVNGIETVSTVQTFSTVGSGAASNFANITIDLTPFAGQDDLRLRFKYSNATWAWWWAIDNVKITGSGPASLTWTPTAGLFTDSLGTVPYTGTPATVVYAKLNNDTSYTATAAALSPPFCNTSSVLNITVTKAGTATGDQVISCGDTTLSSNITLTGYVPAVLGTITGWQMADNPAFTLATTVPGSAGKAVLTPADVTGLSVTTYFRAMILGCPTLYSNAVVVSYPTVTWNGAWNPGPPGPSDNVTVTSGTLTVAAPLSICSLKVNNNATVLVNPGVTLTVNGAVLVAGGAPGGTLNFLDDFTFTNGPASLMQNPATIVSANGGGGFARYERWITTRKFDYTYWSAPLSPSPLLDVSPATLGDKFIRFDANAYQYVFLNAALTTMSPGVGYGVRGPQGISETVFTNHKANFRGTPNNGDISVQVFKNSPANDLNWIGNPYPSAIDADLLMDGNVGPLGANGVGTTFYFWTSNTQYTGGPYNNADFATYNRTGGTLGSIPTAGVPGQMSLLPNGIISACQGFMVKAVTVTPVTGSPVVFRNSMRVAGNNLRFYRQNNTSEKSRIWLDYTNVNSADQYKQILVGYLPNASNGYEDGFDGELIDLGNQITFYSLANADTKKLVIQGRSVPFDDTDQVPLGYRSSAASTYQIALSNQDGLFEDSLVGIYLEDTLLGVIHDLRQAPYQFVTEAGTFDTRFVLRYNNGLLSVNPADLNENNVVVFKQNEQIHIETSLVKMKSVKIFDLQGRLVMAKNDINSQSAILQKVGLANQVLMVQITSVDGAIVNKKIIF
jgi:hypothetical protein